MAIAAALCSSAALDNSYWAAQARKMSLEAGARLRNPKEIQYAHMLELPHRQQQQLLLLLLTRQVLLEV